MYSYNLLMEQVDKAAIKAALPTAEWKKLWQQETLVTTVYLFRRLGRNIYADVTLTGSKLQIICFKWMVPVGAGHAWEMVTKDEPDEVKSLQASVKIDLAKLLEV